MHKPGSVPQEHVVGPRQTWFRAASPLRILWLVALPALLVCVVFSSRTASGPYWYSENLDPSYPYLLNALNLSNFHRPYHVAHPGTPIQTIGALAIRVQTPAADETARAREVLANPEAHLHLINNIFIVLAAACVLAAGFVVFRITGDPVPAIAIQSTAFLSPTTIPGLLGVRPEPLLFGISTLYAAGMLLTLKFDVQAHALKYALGFGMLAGLGMSSKINFLPLLVIPVILLPGLKWKASFGVVALLSFLVFIAPILNASQVAELLGFAVDISTHTGIYGNGSAGVIDAGEFVVNAGRLIARDWLFFLIVAASSVLLVARPARMALGAGRFRILLAVTIAEFLQVLMVAKHPSSRYMIPALGLAGVNLVILFDFLRQGGLPSRSRSMIFAAVCALIVSARGFGLKVEHGEMQTLAARQQGAREVVAGRFGNLKVVDYYSASSPAFALKFGADYSYNLYASILEELHPGSLFYYLGTREFFRFSGPFDPVDLRASGDFLMRGYSLNDSDFTRLQPARMLPDDLVLEPVYGGATDVPGVYDGETVYRARFRR